MMEMDLSGLKNSADNIDKKKEEKKYRANKLPA